MEKKPKRKKYTPGFQDVEMTLEHLENEHRKARRIAWLRERFGKKKKPEKKGGRDSSGKG